MGGGSHVQQCGSSEGTDRQIWHRSRPIFASAFDLSRYPSLLVSASVVPHFRFCVELGVQLRRNHPFLVKLTAY